MAEIITTDIERVAQDALPMAQFGFSYKPVSTNNLKIPVIRQINGRPTPVMVPSAEAETFKNNVRNSIWRQTRMTSSPAANWQMQNRYFSLWVIANSRKSKMLRLDIDNIHKPIQDVFVEAGIVPDDKYAVDARQLYGDFLEAGLPDDFLFAVLIRWDKPFSLI